MTILASLVTLLLIGLTFYVFSSYQWTSGPSPVGHYGGLMERIVFVEILVWFSAAGWRLWRSAGRASSIADPSSIPGARPARLVRRARIMAALNVPMRFILGLPFATPLSRALMLLSFRGRKTGKAYRQPVSYTVSGDTLLTPGGGRWKLNLREDQPIGVRFRGRDVVLRPEFVRDVDEVRRLVGEMIEINPRAAGFMPFIGPNHEIDRAKVETAVSYGFALIRWHFVETRPAETAA